LTTDHGSLGHDNKSGREDGRLSAGYILKVELAVFTEACDVGYERKTE
jgi:hypothetical protein